jgi:hypothetical protein
LILLLFRAYGFRNFNRADAEAKWGALNQMPGMQQACEFMSAILAFLLNLYSYSIKGDDGVFVYKAGHVRTRQVTQPSVS